MRVINTALDDLDKLKAWDRDQVYNGMDCACTHELHSRISQQLDNTTAATYAFSRALQGPVIEMGIRGVLVDQQARADTIDLMFAKIEKIERQLEQIVYDGVGMESFNWRSHADLQRLFYHYLEIPPIRKSGRPTTDASAREKLAAYPIATQLVKHINAITELGDKISTLKTEIDTDGRIRTSYNIAGTSTGRFSSSLSEFGTGGNLQNVEESLRSILIADPGYKFAKCDAKSGESFCVGAIEWNLFRDSRYLDACESGDPHTAVAKLCWPNLPWTGDNDRDKDTAEQPFFRHYSHRFMCKKIGHGSNYKGTPATIAEQTRIGVRLIKEFQPIYFKAFPAHLLWHQWVEDEIRSTGILTTLTGRKRHFFGRRIEASTIREAIAFDPQGSLADIVNTAMQNIWRKGYCQVMMQEHDALTFQYPEKDEDKIIPMLMADLIIPIPLAGGRVLRIPYDCQVGWNKSKYHPEKNPNGLKDYAGHDERKRQTSLGLMDRPVHRGNRKPSHA